MSVQFDNPIMAGADLARPQMQSPNFSIGGQTGWAIYRNGNAYFFNVTATGTITATVFDGTDFVIDSAGAFFYSGTPALGNLAESIASAAGTDGFGNPFLQGFTAYGPQGNVQVWNAAVQFNLTSDVFGGAIVQTAATGGAGGVPGLFISSPTNNNAAGDNSQAFIGMAGQSANGANGPYLYLGSGQSGSSNIQSIPVLIVGGNAAYAAPGVGGGSLVAEGWHTLPLAAGWTSVNGPYYRLTIDGKVELYGSATHAAFAAATQLSTTGALPAAYRPLSTWNTGAPGIPGRAGAEVSTAGTVIAEPGTANCTECDLSGAYPLGL